MAIKCGNHGTEKVYHDTVAQVRACFAGAKGGEATHGDVILTKSELAKIDDGIRQMERYGILPRSSSRVSTLERMAGQPARTASARAATQAPQTTPKGRTLPETFGGSPKQYDYLTDLNEQLDFQYPAEMIDNMDWRQIKAEIPKLQALVNQRRAAGKPADPRQDYRAIQQAAETGLATTDGIFRNPNTGEIFKGQFNRAQGDGRRLYFKRLVLENEMGRGTNIPLAGRKSDAAHLDWEYAGKVQRAQVRQEWLLTRQEAEAFGKLYGVCVRCHRDLTKEESIERAMGPVCAGKQGWA